MELEVTFLRAFKILWSFCWRGMVLMLAIVMPLELVFFFFLIPSLPKPGVQPDAQMLARMSLIMLVAWPLLMAAMLAAQTQAVRWMLKKARWSDFRLVVVGKDGADR